VTYAGDGLHRTVGLSRNADIETRRPANARAHMFRTQLPRRVNGSIGRTDGVSNVSRKCDYKRQIRGAPSGCEARRSCNRGKQKCGAGPWKRWPHSLHPILTMRQSAPGGSSTQRGIRSGTLSQAMRGMAGGPSTATVLSGTRPDPIRVYVNVPRAFCHPPFMLESAAYWSEQYPARKFRGK